MSLEIDREVMRLLRESIKQKGEPMPGQRWTAEVWHADEAEPVLPERSWGWRPRKLSLQLESQAKNKNTASA